MAQQAHDNAHALQSVINDTLFPTVQNIADVKQVLDFMKPVTQPLREEQVRAILYLEQLGNNKLLHPNENPYKPMIDAIKKFRQDVADPEFYLDAIEALVPKPPKPILLKDDGKYTKLQQSKG
ncbi:hypothetical protein [Brevibacillus daliensis]|uniref:hypothetical protein n=1 Tax=Brevibacillus daliensis TaxID=2892995 RepID=UPI001E3AD40F|nr:hypothetical protein [Brevibacillus daliensis]